MNAGIVTIGDELLIGQVLDTNSAWLAARLGEAGFTVSRKLTVGDRGADIERTLAETMASCELTITTGGLGPTKDDITKHTIAKWFGCGMRRDVATWERNSRVLASRGVAYNALNQAQAMVPECAEVIFNNNGTAPGMWFEREGRVLVCLPGVPFEMKMLMDELVIPKLRERFALRKVIHKTAITFGLAESLLAERIASWEDALPDWLHLAYLPSPAQMKLRLSAYDVEGEDELAEIERRFAELEKFIPEYMVGYEDDTVASVAARLLKEKHATLAVAESCTGGAVSAEFTSMAGASDYFLGGVVAYSNRIKADVLGVSPHSLAEHGAVSREVAEQMALGVRRLYDSDYAIATTGIAGPTGGTPEKPVGTVWIAVAAPASNSACATPFNSVPVFGSTDNDCFKTVDDSGAVVFARKFTFGQLRRQNIDRSTATAINMLRLCLLIYPDNVLI